MNETSSPAEAAAAACLAGEALLPRSGAGAARESA
jgi:hypothetical protein